MKLLGSVAITVDIPKKKKKENNNDRVYHKISCYYIQS